jgi:DNA-binding GntR family transcriptional regulator
MPRPKRLAPRKESARELAYRHIQKQIADGTLGAGRPLSELLLARQLGSSRTPVREAISQLAAEGLLEQMPNRGAVVRRLSRHDITDLYEIREALEVFAVAKVAERGLTEEDEARLEQTTAEIRGLYEGLAEAGQAALDAGQMERFVHADLAFHSLIVVLTLNPRMRKLLHETRVLIQIFAIRRRGHDAAMLDRIWRQHATITEALRMRRPDEARRILSEHIHTSLRERLEEFDARERLQAVAASDETLSARR